MRRLWWLIGWLLIAVSPLYAGSVMLNWDNPTTNEDGSPLTDLSHIDVFYGTSSGSYSQQVNAGLVTSASIGGLTDGMTWFFATKAVDTSGNPSVYSNETSAALPPGDTTPPTVSITSPANGAMVQGKSNVTITATAADNVGISVVNITVKNSSNQIIKSCGDSVEPYTCLWAVPAPPNRTYTIQASATDAANNTGTSASVLVTSQ